MVGLHLALIVHDRLVGDQRERKDTHATVARYDDLVGCAHAWRGEDKTCKMIVFTATNVAKKSSFSFQLTDSIGAQPVQYATLSDGLKRGSTQHAVNTLLQEVPVAELLPHIHGQLPQLSVVSVGHAGETHPEPAKGHHGHSLVSSNAT